MMEARQVAGLGSALCRRMRLTRGMLDKAITEGLAGLREETPSTPGPLTTSRTVRKAMMRDLGSRDVEFFQMVRDIRQLLLALGQVANGSYAAIPMQGSGTFCLEAVISSAIPPDGRLGVRGFGFILARRETLQKTVGCTRCLSLDLLDQ